MEIFTRLMLFLSSNTFGQVREYTDLTSAVTDTGGISEKIEEAKLAAKSLGRMRVRQMAMLDAKVSLESGLCCV
jgi:hypothetical protein